MKRLRNINLKNILKLVFILPFTFQLAACIKEEPEFICNGDFFLEKRIVRDANPQFSKSFPQVKKCFKIASVSKTTKNLQLGLDIQLLEVGNGALGNYLTFTLHYPSLLGVMQHNIMAIYNTRVEDFTLDVHQYLHDHQETGLNFNAISSINLKTSLKIKAGVYNFKVISIDKDTRTLTFTFDKIIGISGQDSYVEYVGLNPISIKIPE